MDKDLAKKEAWKLCYPSTQINNTSEGNSSSILWRPTLNSTIQGSGSTVDPVHQVASFASDDEVQVFIELDGGGNRAFAELLQKEM